MQRGCTRPQVPSLFADIAYREHRKYGWQRARTSTGQSACVSCLKLSLQRQPRAFALHGRFQQLRMQALQRPGPDVPGDPAFSQLPVVDITAETVSTSGRGSDDNDNQQHEPNVLRRVVAAAGVLLQSSLHWLRAHLKPWKLFDRCASRHHPQWNIMTLLYLQQHLTVLHKTRKPAFDLHSYVSSAVYFQQP